MLHINLFLIRYPPKSKLNYPVNFYGLGNVIELYLPNCPFPFNRISAELQNDNENCVSRNQTLISNMIEIFSNRDMPVFVLSTLSQVLYKEANELLTFILEVGRLLVLERLG